MAHRIRAAGARSEEERHSGVLVILPGHERMKNRPPRGVAPTTELRRRLIITEIGDFGVAKRRDFRDLKKKEGERMSKLQDIYQRAYNNTPAATVDDNTVGEAVREQIEREKGRAGGTLSEDEWSDLVCLGTSYGQAQGFESGFRYALALIFESLSN